MIGMFTRPNIYVFISRTMCSSRTEWCHAV